MIIVGKNAKEKKTSDDWGIEYFKYRNWCLKNRE